VFVSVMVILRWLVGGHSGPPGQKRLRLVLDRPVFVDEIDWPVKIERGDEV
jgi:hypothetical protein